MMNQRILAIAKMLEKGTCMADIGTDHAKLPIYLVKNGIFEKAYACDIADGPLNIAKEAIALDQLEDKIPCILSNGFENVPNDIDACVFAGIGYYTARDVLDAAIDRLDSIEQIIVQVNNDSDKLREYISEHQWTIVDEVLIKDRKHYYVAIKLSTKKHAPYTKKEQIIGPILMEKGGDLFEEYAKFKANKYALILKNRKIQDAKQEETQAMYDLWMQAANAYK